MVGTRQERRRSVTAAVVAVVTATIVLTMVPTLTAGARPAVATPQPPPDQATPGGPHAAPARVRDQIATRGTSRVLITLATDTTDTTDAGRPRRRRDIEDRAAAVRASLPARERHERSFSQIPLLALTVDADDLAVLERSPDVTHIDEDRLVRPALAESVPLIGAPTLWSSGYTGAGQTVVVVDTGVDAGHPFLGGRVINGACFTTTDPANAATGTCPGANPDAAFGLAAGAPCPVLPDCDHGTHVAGIAAGGTGTGGSGVAYGAGIIAVQVFSRFDDATACGGVAPCALAFSSDWIAALDYVDSTYRLAYDIASVNLSLGSGVVTGNCDGAPGTTSIESLRAHGIATVVAAGNDGSRTGISYPACISSAVAVSATYDTGDSLPAYANSGPLLDLLAPGSSITSSVPGGGFATWEGTSMAAPHVAGSWALLRQAVPGASVHDVLEALQLGGVPVTTSGVTTPRVSLPPALGLLRTAPTLTGVSPRQGPTAGGNVVTLSGSGFSGVQSVRMGGTLATLISSSYTSVSFYAPPHSAGSVLLTLTTRNGSAGTPLAMAYQYGPPPSISAVAPSQGPGGGRNTVTITGTTFTGTTSVLFGSTPATSFTVDTDTTIHAVAPKGSPGTVDLRVTNPMGTSTITATDQYTFLPPTFSLSTPAPPTAGIGAPYTYTLGWTGSPAPTFTVTAGSLPAGVSLAPTGVISGVPSLDSPASYLATVTADNGLDTTTEQVAIDTTRLSFTVDSAVDAVDALPGDGHCATSVGVCSLRAAVQEANSIGGSQKIYLNAPGPYALSLSGANDDVGLTGDLDIDGDVSIYGASTLVSGAGTDRVIDIHGTSVVSLQGLILDGGHVTGEGGALRIVGGSLTAWGVTFSNNSATGDGGAVSSKAPAVLSLTNTTFSNNSATGIGGGLAAAGGPVSIQTSTFNGNTGSVGGGLAARPGTTLALTTDWFTANTAGFGGGIATGGTTTATTLDVTGNTATQWGGGVLALGPVVITGATINGNTAGNYGGGLAGVASTTVTNASVTGNTALRGGGLATTGTAFFTRVTVSGNTAVAGGAGGGILNAGTMTVTTSTVSTNTAPTGGGILNGGTTYGWSGHLDVVDATLAKDAGGDLTNDAGASVTITNSILDRKTAPGSACTGAITSGDYNLSSDTSCGFGGAHDLQGTGSGTGPLANNGGPGYSHLPGAGSPARDTGKPGCTGTDERGVTRPQGPGCDRGAIDV